MKRAAVIALLFLAGCFDSLLGSPCKAGYALRDGQCVVDHGAPPDALTFVIPDATMKPTGDAGPDAGPADDAGPTDAGPDAPLPDAPPTPDAPPPDAPPTPDAPLPPDGPTCGDLETDPLNCGACGHVCASGICAAGTCAGEVRGHIVAIGHDYAAWNAPMVRVLGNALALGAHHDLAIARWSTASPAVTTALASALAAVGRPAHVVTLPTTPSPTALASADVIVVDPRATDGAAQEATGVAWAGAFASYLAGGGVVIVLEGSGGTNYRFARGANLFDTAAPIAVTGTHLLVTAGADAVALQVLSPYHAAASTVAYPTLSTGTVVRAPGTGAVVFHEARP